MNDVYVICESDNAWLRGPVKVGVARDPARRLAQLQTGSPRKLMVLHWFPCLHKDLALETEKTFHKMNHAVRLQGEWFDMPPYEAVARVGVIIGGLVREFHPKMEDKEFGRFLVDSGLAKVFAIALNIRHNSGEN